MRLAYAALAEIPSERANTIQVMKVCQSLAQLGHAPTLLLPDQAVDASGRDWDSLAARYGLQTRFEIEWLRLPWGRRGLFACRAALRARRLGARALYVRAAPLAVCGLLAGLPVLLEMHELPCGQFGPRWYRLFLSLPGRKRVLAISQALLLRLEEEYRTAPSGGMLNAPDGVDLERYAGLPEPEAARRSLGLAPGATVLCTGHLYAGRGVPLFLELASRLPQVNFVWAGGRPQEVEQWRARAEGLALHNLTFTGFIPNRLIPGYQAAADVLLMPYERRISVSGGGNTADFCSPLKMFEYMASGRAILSSDLPVLREVLDESTAVFCRPEDADGWAAALTGLLADGERRQALGRRARQAVEPYAWTARSRRVLEGFLEAA